MASLLDDFRSGFWRRYGAVGQLITLNVALFLPIALFNALIFLATGPGGAVDGTVYDWLGVRAYLPALATRPWTPLSYMFVHDLRGIFHLLVNMLWLYWIGGWILRDFLPDKRIWGLYLMGGLAGAGLYVLAYNLLPAFADVRQVAVLYGASASVLAIVVGTATLVPNYTVNLLFFGPVKLKWLALVSVLIDIIQIPNNPGGMIAHLGGALIGMLYLSSYARGNDWLAPLDGLIESVSGALRPRSRSERHVRVSVRGAAPSARAATRPSAEPGKPSQAEVDRILDKIKSVGYERLTTEEKQTLFNASKD